MARRKTHRKKTHHRRRSISGFKGSEMNELLMIVGGAVAGRVITAKIKNCHFLKFQKFEEMFEFT